MPTSNHLLNHNGMTIGYRLFLPKVFEGSLPLIVFLHGMKKRGSDLQLLDDENSCMGLSL